MRLSFTSTLLWAECGRAGAFHWDKRAPRPTGDRADYLNRGTVVDVIMQACFAERWWDREQSSLALIDNVPTISIGSGGSITSTEWRDRVRGPLAQTLDTWREEQTFTAWPQLAVQRRVTAELVPGLDTYGITDVMLGRTVQAPVKISKAAIIQPAPETQILVLDVKAGRVGSGDGRQLDLYGHTTRAIAPGAAIRTGYLHPLHDAKVHAHRMKPLADTLALVAKAKARIDVRDSSPVVGPHCERCFSKSICAEGIAYLNTRDLRIPLDGTGAVELSF